MKGRYSMERGWWDHPVFQGDPVKQIAWERLIASAAYKHMPFISNGQPITLERGQFATSVRHLAHEWGSKHWSKSKVSRFLTRLKTESMIETDMGTGRFVITIINYDTYQPAPKNAGRDVGHDAGQQRDSSGTIKKKDNNPSIEGGEKSPSQEHSVETLRTRIFREGKALLVAGGKSQTSAGALLNKWLADHGESAVISAIVAAQAKGGTADPFSYINGIFRDKQKTATQAKPKGAAVGSPEFNALWGEQQ
jgi:hypothetical protein